MHIPRYIGCILDPRLVNTLYALVTGSASCKLRPQRFWRGPDGDIDPTARQLYKIIFSYTPAFQPQPEEALT